jgi:hypothetical protein
MEFERFGAGVNDGQRYGGTGCRCRLLKQEASGEIDCPTLLILAVTEVVAVSSVGAGAGVRRLGMRCARSSRSTRSRCHFCSDGFDKSLRRLQGARVAMQHIGQLLARMQRIVQHTGGDAGLVWPT